MKLSKIALAPRVVDEEVAAFADEIRDRLGATLRMVDQIASIAERPASNDPVREQDVRVMIKLRRARDRFFGIDMFADPAWDILLELYASELTQMKISVSGLCEAAAVPPTTALRWVHALEEAGVIQRSPDRLDGRRIFISLSARGLEAMTNYFRLVPQGSTVI
jgi:DNA-binding MarR family transcriptional regulator